MNRLFRLAGAAGSAGFIGGASRHGCLHTSLLEDVWLVRRGGALSADRHVPYNHSYEDVLDVPRMRADGDCGRPWAVPSMPRSLPRTPTRWGPVLREQALMLRFSMFGIPVGVHWSFPLIGILVIGSNPLELVAAFVIGVFIAVLAHELGHALTARAFGAKSIKVTLFGLGGLTQYPVKTPLTAGQQFLIAASGSAVGMAIGGGVFVSRHAGFVRDLPDFVYAVGVGVVIAGLLWGALNWLPILPLDGGNMARYALAIATPTYALRIAKGLTIVTAAVIIYVAINLWDNTFGAVFVGIIALQGLQIPERTSPEPKPRAVTDPGSLLSIFDDEPKG